MIFYSLLTDIAPKMMNKNANVINAFLMVCSFGWFMASCNRR